MSGGAAGRRVHAGSLTAAIVLGALAAWACAEAVGYGLWRGRSPGEGLYPFIAAAAVATMALAFAVQAVTDPADPPREDADAPPAWAKVAVYLAGLLAFGLALEPLGWLPVTAGVLLLILKVAERLPWSVSLGVVAATVAATHVVFERLLGLPLPRGVLS
ncbi:MAG TPA: tripartite tricarboxylate transporter TctB family protein [Salinarimonas sp.]|nr:tripartite tricarboxylate transporter TctB family protein [Salinarimonas sp.]